MSLVVVPLVTVKTSAQADVVALLEKRLTQAKAGEYDGFAYAASRVDGSVDNGFSDHVDFHRLVSGVAIVQYRMLSRRQVL